MRSNTDVHRDPVNCFERVYDLCLVRPPEAPLHAHDFGDRRELANLIAFGEYCFQVPANRIGYGHFTGYQLKVMQECITLVVFFRVRILLSR